VSTIDPAATTGPPWPRVSIFHPRRPAALRSWSPLGWVKYRCVPTEVIDG
jgi:hypothetical protein